MRITITLFLSLLLINLLNAQCPSGEVELQIEINTDSYGYEGYWEVVPVDSACGEGTILSGGNTAVGCDGAGLQNQTPGGYANNSTYTSSTACITEGGNYKLIYIDDWGDGGFEFFVYINGYLIDEFEGGSSIHFFDFNGVEPPAYNLSMLHAHVAPYQAAGDIDIECEIFNGGTETITSLDLHYQIDNGSVETQQLTGLNIAHGSNAHLDHPTPWTVQDNGTYDLKIWYTDLNGNNADADPSDDEVETEISIGPPVPNILDSYLINLPVITQISAPSDLLNIPTDLDFHPVLTNYELWVVNKDYENTGSSTVTFYNVGKENQASVWKRDGNAWHFMSLTTGLAFSENSNFATSPGVFDANHNGGTPFTGPALWSSDPAIYAQPSGGNGSHLDMLHESPKCQGIAAEKDNAFWVFDGHNRDIVRYDFVKDHGPGNDDHSDGEILRFSDISMSPDASEEIPSHLEYDKNTDWLYVVDQNAARVIKIDTKSGNIGGTPSFGPFEPLAQYAYVQNYDWDVVIDTGLVEPVGIDLIDDRMLVSDYETGRITIYDISTTPATELKRIETNAEGIMGITLGPDGKIWFVDHIAESINRIDWMADTTTIIPEGVSNLSHADDFKLFPNPTHGAFTIINPTPHRLNYFVYNTLGSQVSMGTLRPGRNKLTLNVSKGAYILSVRADAFASHINKNIIIQ